MNFRNPLHDVQRDGEGRKAGISHGVTLTQKNGTSVAGYITGETDEGVTIRLPGGVSQKILSKDITDREDMQQSPIPPGLATGSLKKEELADLVAYLQSLK